MRATKKKLAVLSGVLAGCIVLFLALTLTGREGEAVGEERYYFTNYSSAQELMLASVENAGGSMILAQAGGEYQAISDAPVSGDPEEIGAFFEELCRIPLERLVEGAAAGDSQYGLTEPRATVLVQDITQGGAMFLLGNEVPGGDGVYTCLAGDERVFVMSRTYADSFLDNVERFLDLRLYPSAEGSALTEIEVRRAGETAYRLEQAGAAGSDTVYFSLREPWSLLLGAEPVKSALLTPLRQLEGVRILEGDPVSDYGLMEAADSFHLRYEDGTAAVVLVGARDGEYTPVTVPGSGFALAVPTASLAFMDASAPEVMGGVLVRLNLNDIGTLTLNDHTYELASGAGELRVTRDGASYDAAEFQNTVFPALNHISIGGPYDGAAGAELLRLHIASNIGGEAVSLTFRELDGRRCAVEIGGQTAVWCDLAAVSVLLGAAD